MKRLLFFILFLSGCVSNQKQLGEKLDVAAARLAHLPSYKELQCEVRVDFAETVKSAWQKRLPKNGRYSPPGGGKQIFKTLDSQVYDWRITPYRCRVTAKRSGPLPDDVKIVLADTEKKLDSVLCIWLQSFYADSPLRGWRKSEGSIELAPIPGGIKIIKGFERGLEVYSDGQQVVARMGPGGGSLTGNYEMIGNKLYPQLIEQKVGLQLNRLQDIVYSNQYGREVPSTFWLSLANEEGLPISYFQVHTNACTLR